MSGVRIIAEAGVNHNGSLDMALGLVDAAAESGADVVKFQTFSAEALVSATARKAEYQEASTGGDEGQLAMLRRLELSREKHLKIAERCRERGIEFLSTAFDPGSIEMLQELGVKLWKIPSGEITNLPFLRRIGSMRAPVLLSTGMSMIGEVDEAISALLEAGTTRDDITLLHCTTEYPAPVAEANLRAMATMGAAFGLRYGYSDHTPGIAVPIAAVALGACVIEKHFTLDKGLRGPDHKASLDPGELRAMVESIRSVESALGDGVKRVSAAELKNRPIARKFIVAARSIASGEILGSENLAAKRVGGGISPMRWDEVSGAVALRDFRADEAIDMASIRGAAR